MRLCFRVVLHHNRRRDSVKSQGLACSNRAFSPAKPQRSLRSMLIWCDTEEVNWLLATSYKPALVGGIGCAVGRIRISPAHQGLCTLSFPHIFLFEHQNTKELALRSAPKRKHIPDTCTTTKSLKGMIAPQFGAYPFFNHEPANSLQGSIYLWMSDYHPDGRKLRKPVATRWDSPQAREHGISSSRLPESPECNFVHQPGKPGRRSS